MLDRVEFVTSAANEDRSILLRADQPPARWAGRVTERGGGPIEGASVRVDQPGERLLLPGECAEVGGGGSFVIEAGRTTVWQP